MTKQLPRRDRQGRRDGGKRTTGTPPPTEQPPAKEKTSRRPADPAPAPGTSDRVMDEHAFLRQKELNPDDFE